MKVALHVVLDVVPGSMKTVEEITADASSAISNAAYQFGSADYGPDQYQVRSVTVN